MARFDLGWMILRVVLGASLALFHGYGKVFEGGAARLAGGVERMGLPAPSFLAWCAALAEFAGGLLVAVGLATRPASIFVGITMVVALYTHRDDPFSRMELAMIYLAFAVAAFLIGGGRYSLDRKMRLRMPFGPKE